MNGNGFLRRWIVHVEWRPRHGGLNWSIRRAPQHGDRVMNGDEPSVLEGCRDCGTVGFFARPLVDRPRSMATDQPCP